ncbi:glycosyltransferase, partial [Streptomyces daliensis]|nr:glycosyltransferase [Streptomyces daliensis]
VPRRRPGTVISSGVGLRGTIKATEQVLERTKADCVVGFGGYVALPAYLAAKRLGVPIVVHEANARPGLANKIGSRYTRHVAVS